MLSSDFAHVTVVLPSLNPDEKLQKTVASLLAAGFTYLVLVNDGSREDTLRFFPKEDEHITVLRHEVNRGKGAALKTAFRYVLEHRPDSPGVVTADGDGQHRAEDVRRCAEAMIADGRPEDRFRLPGLFAAACAAPQPHGKPHHLRRLSHFLRAAAVGYTDGAARHSAGPASADADCAG